MPFPRRNHSQASKSHGSARRGCSRLRVRQALAYSNSRSSEKIAHISSIFTCTYGILFFGTPHNGSSKARLLGTLQKLASVAVPQKVGQFESSLVSALEEESETLQDITDHFVPLMKNFCIYFFWEQEKTDLKYTRDYIVNQESAAPVFDNTERSGIAADHSSMVKFSENTSQGFRSVAAALDRYCEEAPDVIRRRCIQAAQAQDEERCREAMELYSSIKSYLVGVPYATPFVGSIEGRKQPEWLRTGCGERPTEEYTTNFRVASQPEMGPGRSCAPNNAL
jgi:hypothetical protein